MAIGASRIKEVKVSIAEITEKSSWVVETLGWCEVETKTLVERLAKTELTSLPAMCE